MTGNTSQPLLGTLPLMYFRKDTHNRILRVNKAVADSFGVTREEMANTDTARWYPNDAEAYFEEDLEVIRTGQPRIGYIQYLDVGGHRRRIRVDKFPHYDERGELDGVHVFIQDETHQGHTELALHRSREKLRSILLAAPDLMIVLDAAGRYVDIFPAAQHMLVAPPEKLLGRSIHEVLPGDLAAGAQGVIDRTLETGELQEMEYTLPVRGQNVIFSGRVVPFETDEGTCVLWTARDITRRKEMEESRRRLEQKVLETQKLESLGVLAGGIAHDFNNLLVGILGNADLARRALADGSDLRPRLEGIEEAALRAADLCKQMLAYSGRGRFAVEAVDLSRLVSDMANLLQLSVSRRAEMKYDLATNLPPVQADATQIRQVVMNLITNAAEAVGERGGEIAIATGVRHCSGEFLEQSRIDGHEREGEYVYFEVSDDGSGMDEQTAARIFDPFFTTKFTGRGLGLAAVSGIVRSHRGVLRLTTRPGQGTCVTVMLPCTREDSAPAPSSDAPAAASAGTILVVDDEDLVRDVAAGALESAGFVVRAAHDGDQALDLFARHRDEIVCVVLDLTLPPAGGAEVYRCIRAAGSDVPVILSSGYGDESFAEGTQEAGFAAFLRKPYRAEALIDLVVNALR